MQYEYLYLFRPKFFEKSIHFLYLFREYHRMTFHNYTENTNFNFQFYEFKGASHIVITRKNMASAEQPTNLGEVYKL